MSNSIYAKAFEFVFYLKGGGGQWPVGLTINKYPFGTLGGDAQVPRGLGSLLKNTFFVKVGGGWGAPTK